MQKRKKQAGCPVVIFTWFAAALILNVVSPAFAVYVLPRIGGDQRKHDVAPMIMPEITFDGTNVRVLQVNGSDWETLTDNARPVMWPLQGTDEFDPVAVYYSALNGTAYNWQYGWNGAAFDPTNLPTGGKVWMEVLSQSAGLKTYDRNNSYAPIFGTNGSSLKWKWPQMMAHNAYTVVPSYAEWEATYKVYIGNETTGDPLSGYGYDIVTFTWTSVPEPATIGLLAAGILFIRWRKRI